ncbi:MAG: hypothetical protein ACYSUK_00210 [Planctomycetota bacterium]|jgi:hypothetical protein
MNLVERLQNDIQQWGDFGTLKSEAAAEIERLEADNDRLRAALKLLGELERKREASDE